jgi:hypothetical protein
MAATLASKAGSPTTSSRLTSFEAHRASVASWSPCRILKTPPGKPLRAVSSARAKAAEGALGLGLSTTVAPESSTGTARCSGPSKGACWSLTIATTLPPALAAIPPFCRPQQAYGIAHLDSRYFDLLTGFLGNQRGKVSSVFRQSITKRRQQRGTLANGLRRPGRQGCPRGLDSGPRFKFAAQWRAAPDLAIARIADIEKGRRHSQVGVAVDPQRNGQDFVGCSHYISRQRVGEMTGVRWLSRANHRDERQVVK